MSAGMKISRDEEHWLGIKPPSLCPGFVTYSMILSKSPKLISKTGRVSVYFLDYVRIKWLTNLEWYLAHRNLVWPKTTQLLHINRSTLNYSGYSWGWASGTLSLIHTLPLCPRPHPHSPKFLGFHWRPLCQIRLASEWPLGIFLLGTVWKMGVTSADPFKRPLKYVDHSWLLD